MIIWIYTLLQIRIYLITFIINKILVWIAYFEI